MSVPMQSFKTHTARDQCEQDVTAELHLLYRETANNCQLPYSSTKDLHFNSYSSGNKNSGKQDVLTISKQAYDYHCEMYQGNTLQWLTTLLSTQKLILQVFGHRALNMLNYLQSVHPTANQLHHIIILPPPGEHNKYNYHT